MIESLKNWPFLSGLVDSSDGLAPWTGMTIRVPDAVRLRLERAAASAPRGPALISDVIEAGLLALGLSGDADRAANTAAFAARDACDRSRAERDEAAARSQLDYQTRIARRQLEIDASPFRGRIVSDDALEPLLQSATQAGLTRDEVVHIAGQDEASRRATTTALLKREAADIDKMGGIFSHADLTRLDRLAARGGLNSRDMLSAIGVEPDDSRIAAWQAARIVRPFETAKA